MEAAEALARGLQVLLGAHLLEAVHLRAALTLALLALPSLVSLLKIDKGRRELTQKMENSKCMRMDKKYSVP